MVDLKRAFEQTGVEFIQLRDPAVFPGKSPQDPFHQANQERDIASPHHGPVMWGPNAHQFSNRGLARRIASRERCRHAPYRRGHPSAQGPV